MTPYRTHAGGAPIEDGRYEDFLRLVGAVQRASRQLDLPVISADHPKSSEVGYEVGSYRWFISARLAMLTCPPNIRPLLATEGGRRLLAQLLTKGRI